MYRWKAYNYRDIEQTFRLLGHTVDNIEQELGNYELLEYILFPYTKPLVLYFQFIISHFF